MMQSVDMKARISKRLEEVENDYVNDLEAMSQEALDRSPGGAARSPYDFTYEVTFVNKRIATRLSGETPDPWVNEGWMKAPDEHRDKAKALEEFKATFARIRNAWEAVPPEEIEKMIKLPSGAETSPLALVTMAIEHTMYHDAQLNYHQAISGDAEMHWKD